MTFEDRQDRIESGIGKFEPLGRQALQMALDRGEYGGTVVLVPFDGDTPDLRIDGGAFDGTWVDVKSETQKRPNFALAIRHLRAQMQDRRWSPLWLCFIEDDDGYCRFLLADVRDIEWDRMPVHTGVGYDPVMADGRRTDFVLLPKDSPAIAPMDEFLGRQPVWEA